MGHLLRKRLGRWASRRHPNKPVTWVKQKYFADIKGARNWVFNDGEYILNQYSDVPTVANIKVKGIASP